MTQTIEVAGWKGPETLTREEFTRQWVATTDRLQPLTDEDLEGQQDLAFIKAIVQRMAERQFDRIAEFQNK